MASANYTPADLDPIASALSLPLREVYFGALARQFFGDTVEHLLTARRLVEAGWTLARLLEACEGAVDGEADGLRELLAVVEGRLSE